MVKRGYIPGSVHTSIGQEAQVVGATMALRKGDHMTGNHRSHGHPIGMGSPLGPLMAELVGKATGTPWFADYGRALIGAWGCVIFIAAMWFDLKDRLRVTRLAENALWLHLAAAPMLVHAVLFGGDGTTGLGYALGMMALLSVAALLIDRRALLVSGLGYFAVAISQLVSSGAVSGVLNFAVTTVILGGVMLVLGLGWTPIRARLVAAVPFDGLKSRLPPALP